MTRRLCRILGSLLSEPVKAQTCTVSNPDSTELSQLILLSDEHMVTPSLCIALLGECATASDDLSEDVRYLKGVQRLNSNRNRSLLCQAGEIAGILGPARVDFVFLKGLAHLLGGIYPDVSCRFIGDIDLLIPSDCVERALSAFQAAGYRESRERHPGSHDILYLSHKERPASLDVHQFVLHRDTRHLIQECSFLDRRNRVEVAGGAFAYIPDPADMIAHNIWHAMVHHPHFVRSEIPLRDALDLCLLAEAFKPRVDWDEIASRIRKDRRGPAILDFYCNGARTLFLSDAIPVFPRCPEAALSRWRWHSRNGRRMNPYEDRGYLRNVADFLVWRFLVDREGRRKMTRSTLEFGRYASHFRRIKDIAANVPKKPDHG